MTKYIYLDQNKWIDLARAYHGREDGKIFKDVQLKIFEKSNNGEWKFPLSVAHHIETMSALNRERRTRLASVMSIVSKNCSIQPYINLEYDELRNAIKNLYSLPLENLIPKAIQDDYFAAIGLDSSLFNITSANPIVKKIVEEFLKNESLFEKINNLDFDENTLDFVRNSNQESSEFIKNIEQDRQKFLKIPEEHQLNLHIYEYFNAKLIPYLPKIMKELNLTREELANKLSQENRAMEICYAIPTLDTRARLSYRNIRDTGRPIDKNDSIDEAFLCMAIPYCDIVVTENKWTHYAKQEKLDQKYNTKIFDSLNELLDL